MTISGITISFAGKGEEKGEQDHAVQPEQPPRGVEKGSQVRENRHTADVEVGQQPDDRARWRGYRCLRRPRTNSVRFEHAAHDHLPYLRRAVRR